MSGSIHVPPGSLMGMLEPADRALLLEAGRLRRYRRGAHIIIQGDEDDDVFVILSGRVKVTVNTSEGREVLLAIDGPGELLGEFEAIDTEQRRAASNVALEAVECRAMTGQEFRDLLASSPNIPLILLKWAVRRFLSADRRRVDAAAFDTVHRLARLLIEVADGFAHADPSRVDLDLPVTQEELASSIAASRDSVVRALTSLRLRGLIATTRGRITILDIDELRRYSQAERSTPQRSSNHRPSGSGAAGRDRLGLPD